MNLFYFIIISKDFYQVFRFHFQLIVFEILSDKIRFVAENG